MVTSSPGKHTSDSLLPIEGAVNPLAHRDERAAAVLAPHVPRAHELLPNGGAVRHLPRADERPLLRRAGGPRGHAASREWGERPSRVRARRLLRREAGGHEPVDLLLEVPPAPTYRFLSSTRGSWQAAGTGSQQHAWLPLVDRFRVASCAGERRAVRK